MTKTLINVDVNVTKNDYADHIKVTSIFYSFQGEGPHSGRPFIFLRLAGCNFGSKSEVCRQCDTQFSMASAKDYDVDKLFSELLDIGQAHDCHDIILTGGEPTLQPMVLCVLEKWVEQYPNSLIQIETNGTQPLFFGNQFKEIRHNVEVCCSPKCNEVTGVWTKIHPNVSKYVTYYKFLVSHKEFPYNKLPDYINSLTKPVYVSPITVYRETPPNVASIWEHYIDAQQTRDNYAHAAEIVLYPKLFGLQIKPKLSLQTHLFCTVP